MSRNRGEFYLTERDKERKGGGKGRKERKRSKKKKHLWIEKEGK